MMQKRQIPSLDGFRAIAVGIVIFSHLCMTRVFDEPVNTLLGSVFVGKIGVEIFFVLSGFLITYNLIREKKLNGRINLGIFYARRVLRILPAFYFYLTVIVVINYVFDLKITPLAFLSAFIFVHNFSPWGSHWFLNHAWTLGVEEQFYLLWPLILMATKKLNFRLCWVIMLCAGTFMRSLHYKYPILAEHLLSDFIMYSDFLFSGCFMAYLYDSNREGLLRYFQKLSPLLVYVAMVMIWCCYALEFHPTYDKVTIPLAGTIANISISFLVLYFVLNSNTTGYRFLNSFPVTFIGKLSYSLYLWQQFFINPDNHWFDSIWVSILFLFISALVSYYLIERPFLKLKDKLGRLNTSPGRSEILLP